MREQVEERLAFYEGGKVPRKNVDVMRQVLEEVKSDLKEQGVNVQVKAEEQVVKNENEKREAVDAPAAAEQGSAKKHKKEKKKDKKKEKKDKKKKEKK